MKKLYLVTALLVIFSSLFVMVAEASPNFSLPILNSQDWYDMRGSQYHHDIEQYAIDFNHKGGADKDIGQPVYAVADGVVTTSRDSDAIGGCIVIEHGKDFRSEYMHLNGGNLKVKKGEYVKQGDLIGYVGNRDQMGSNAKGPHLHFAVHQKINGSWAAYNLDEIPAFLNIEKRGDSFIEGTYYTVKDYISSIVNEKPPEPLKPIDLKPIAEMVTKFYTWALSAGGVLALGIMIYGGVLYTASAGNESNIKEAKEWLKAAIFGLILLLSVYLILYTVNPCIVSPGSSGCT